MKTNINQNNDAENFTTYLSKLNQLYSMKITATLLLLFVFSTTITVGQSGSCSADLRVEKNRTNRSTPADGTYYSMVISNKGRTVDTFSLSSLNVNTTSSNPDKSSTVKNVILNVEFLDKQFKSINEIKVNPGETISFLAHILVPKGTPFDKWSCTQVVAKSRTCSNYKVDTILHTLVINVNEDN